MGIRKTVKGLKGIYYSPVPASGLIEDATWTQLALNLEGTFSMNQEEGRWRKLVLLGWITYSGFHRKHLDRPNLFLTGRT